MVGVHFGGEGGARLFVEADRNHPMAFGAQRAHGYHGQLAPAGDQPDDARTPGLRVAHETAVAAVNG